MARVLVVDDERSIRLTLSRFLQRDGHEIVEAPDAEKAQQLLRDGSFDVVVTDIVLPCLSGVELLHSIREAAPRVKVVMMTGEPTVESASEAVRAGAADYLMKPIARSAILRSGNHAAEVTGVDDERTRLEEENRRYQEDLERLVDVRTGELRKTNERLEKAMEGIVQAVALTVEKKDLYTAGHQQRVAELARAIGEDLNLADDQLRGTYLAGVIHDLGKIGLPVEILSKPGKLTSIELAMIKGHPQDGYEILKDIEFPWPIADIVLQHHERMNGSGYPHGLKGDKILREARILAVADAVEAMAADRPYRPALGLEKALNEITENRLTLYDADAVDACVGLFRQKGYTLKQVNSPPSAVSASRQFDR